MIKLSLPLPNGSSKFSTSTNTGKLSKYKSPTIELLKDVALAVMESHMSVRKVKVKTKEAMSLRYLPMTLLV